LGGDKRFTLGRALVAAWLNVTIGGNDFVCIEDAINDGIAWMLQYAPGGNPLDGGDPVPEWVDDGDVIFELLEFYNNTGAGCAPDRENNRPENVSVIPSSGSGPVGVVTYFTTTWSDPNGWFDLKQCYFHIGASASKVNNVTLMYNVLKDKLWILSDDGSTWLGGYEPGSANVLENSQALVDCSLTTAEGAWYTVEVRWAITFKPGFTGTKKLGMKCMDRHGARDKGMWMGTWTIY
jgi:hypothetical protein